MSSIATFVIAVSALVGQAEEKKQELSPGQENMKQMEFLIGTWESEHNGKVTTGSFEWINNKSYIMAVAGDYREIYGWDLKAEKIVCWAFGTDGGQGKFYWTKEGNTWKGVNDPPFLTRIGAPMDSEQSIEIVDADTLKWTWTIKKKDGPDKEMPFTMTRVKPKEDPREQVKKERRERAKKERPSRPKKDRQPKAKE